MVGSPALCRSGGRDRARPADRRARGREGGTASIRVGGVRGHGALHPRLHVERVAARPAGDLLGRARRALRRRLAPLRSERARSRPGRPDGRGGHRGRDAAGRRGRLLLRAAVVRERRRLAAAPLLLRFGGRRRVRQLAGRRLSSTSCRALAPATRPLLRPERSMPSLSLGRFRMLDLSRQLPGPFCSTLLADLGMDVLVITAPRDPFGLGIPFLARNKRSMTLDLKTNAGREVFLRLVDGTDVLLEGFRPGVMQRLGFDWEALRARNPRLVYCAISGYGQDGPYRDKVGHDVNYLGYAGVLEYAGAPDGGPMIPPVQVADVGAGSLMAAVGILSALMARDETGRGQMVDISMLDGAAAWNVCHQTIHWFSGQLPKRGKEQLTGHWPCYHVYQTRDERWVTVGAYEPHFWSTL